MTVAISSIGSGRLAIDITGVASTAAAGQGQILNPEGCDLHICRAHILAKTESTGSSELDIGVAATGVQATDVLDGDDMNGVTEGKCIQCFAEAGAKTELVPAVWTAAKYLTFTASATLVGFTGTLFVEYLRTLPE